MERSYFTDADLYRRREVFADLVSRADLAPAWQRDHLLDDAVMIACLHQELTGTPLVPNLNTYPGVAERMPHVPAIDSPSAAAD